MKISYNWLKSYVKDLPSPEKLADIFSFHICELESYEKIENGDYVFDLKILPDRAHDLLSHRGVARDLAGILGLEIKFPEFRRSEEKETNLSIKIETKNCRRYMGRIVRNIQVEESAKWVREYLEAMGQRSINNLVDMTNIVMFDTGNPIHVFDLDKLADGVIVRQAQEKEKIITLDGKEIVLNQNNMAIADTKDILAIAGIKGGKKAEVDENTKNIIIEVANFDSTNVRKTSRAINIFTDAVKRFENDLSPEVVDTSMAEISNLILENCPDAIFEQIVDVYPEKQVERKLQFSIAKISKILGMKISEKEVEKILENFKYKYKKEGDIFGITVPVERLDLNIEEDMAEEIGRVIGYDKIEVQIPEIKNPEEGSMRVDEVFAKILWARNKLLNEGYSEVMNYTFCDKGEVEVLASASDKKFIRTNLTDGLQESLRLNKLNMPLLGMKEIKIFEIGTVFLKDKEEIHITWNEKEVIKEMTLDEFCKEASPDAFLQILGSLGTQPQPDHSEKHASSAFTPWSFFPFIVRDIAVWVPEEVESNQVHKVIKENAGELLVRGPELFDEFKKDNKTSFAFRMVFQAHDRTLTDEEVNKIMDKINQKIAEYKDWQIR